MKNFSIAPVGYVVSPVKAAREMPAGGVAAAVEILPQYEAALLGIEENSHVWILTWFHQAERARLTSHPRGDQELPEYGVFALRSPHRPNPVALTPARLLSRAGNRINLDRLDAVDGTPVIDIKPYVEKDMIFSARSFYRPGRDREYRQQLLLRRAAASHGEECLPLQLAVRMALVAEEVFGQLSNPELLVAVRGQACLADAIQILSQARLANPPRFSFVPSHNLQQTNWDLPGRGTLTLTWLGRPEAMELEDEELLNIDYAN